TRRQPPAGAPGRSADESAHPAHCHASTSRLARVHRTRMSVLPDAWLAPVVLIRSSVTNPPPPRRWMRRKKKQRIGRPPAVACTGKGHALEYNRRLAGERYPSRVPAEGANSHNRSSNSYCESDPTLPRQCRTASWREVARQPTEGASSPSTA